MEFLQSNRKSLMLAAQAVVTTALVVLGLNLSQTISGAVTSLPPEVALGVVKLVGAAAIAYLIVSVQRFAATDRTLARPMEQAQILLCIAGALVVMLIGDSMPRAIGILGGAAIVRFRTPVDDPKDATLLFLLLGLGMASGLGYFAIAGLGALFLCVVLLLFQGIPDQKLRSLTVQVVCAGTSLPTAAVESILEKHAASFEPREITKGDRPILRYQVSVDSALPLAGLSRELLDSTTASIQSVSFDTPKKDRYL
jgi:hypothetical protein